MAQSLEERGAVSIRNRKSPKKVLTLFAYFPWLCLFMEIEDLLSLRNANQCVVSRACIAISLDRELDRRDQLDATRRSGLDAA